MITGTIRKDTRLVFLVPDPEAFREAAYKPGFMYLALIPRDSQWLGVAPGPSGFTGFLALVPFTEELGPHDFKIILTLAKGLPQPLLDNEVIPFTYLGSSTWTDRPVSYFEIQPLGIENVTRDEILGQQHVVPLVECP